MKKLLAFLLFANISYTQFNPNSFTQYLKENPTRENRKESDIIQDFPQLFSYINWTTGNVVTEYKIPITYEDPNVGRTIADLTSKLKQEILEYMMATIQKIQVTSVYVLEDAWKRDNDIQKALLSYLYLLPIENPTIQGSYIQGRISFPLYGDNSITDPIYQNIKPIQVTNYLIPETTAVSYYDTLIIDTVMIKNFKPSLMLTIMDQSSNTLHSYDSVELSVLQTQGPVHYVSSITEAFNHPARGKKVAYILPLKSVGLNNTDLMLFDTDSKRIFSQKRSLDAFKKGKVIVITSQKK